jgi:competence protein ComGC
MQRKRTLPPRRHAGFGFTSILLVLLVLAALYFGYLRPPSATDSGSVGTSAIDAGRSVACRTNRQTLERSITMWAIDHPRQQATFGALQAEGVHVPSCPQGGSYDIDGRQVRCSLHGP